MMRMIARTNTLKILMSRHDIGKYDDGIDFQDDQKENFDYVGHDHTNESGVTKSNNVYIEQPFHVRRGGKTWLTRMKRLLLIRTWRNLFRMPRTTKLMQIQDTEGQVGRKAIPGGHLGNWLRVEKF